MEIDTICMHSGDHFRKGKVYQAIQDKADWYLGEWEMCPDCRTPICGFCMAAGCCYYHPVSAYHPPKCYVKPTTTRSRMHKTTFVNDHR